MATVLSVLMIASVLVAAVLMGLMFRQDKPLRGTSGVMAPLASGMPSVFHAAAAHGAP